MTEDETIVAVLTGRSIARFGDGELKIATGGSAKSQPGSPGLRRLLCEILKDVTGPCLPAIPTMDPRAPDRKRLFWDQYRAERFTRLLIYGAIYGSALITRPDSAPWNNRPGYWRALRSIWEGREVILVRGGKKGLGPADMRGATVVAQVTTPLVNAWADHKAILGRVRKAGTKDRRVILCVGAAATGMAYILAQEGVHAIDLGHVALFMRKLDKGEDPEVRTDADKGDESVGP